MFLSASQLMASSDLEDAFQYQTALVSGLVAYFVTGNIKDFRLVDQIRLPIITPTDMVALLAGTAANALR